MSLFLMERTRFQEEMNDEKNAANNSVGADAAILVHY